MDNMLKNLKYKDLMEKLKKSINNEFYYESIFIEYAILEDRTESLLRHANLKYRENDGKEFSLYKKLKRIEESPIFYKDKYINKHIKIELLYRIHDWKNKRNDLIHALIKTKYNNDDIKKIALEGNELIKILNNKSTLVNKHLDNK